MYCGFVKNIKVKEQMYFGGTELFVVPLLLLVWELREEQCDLKLQSSW